LNSRNRGKLYLLRPLLGKLRHRRPALAGEEVMGWAGISRLDRQLAFALFSLVFVLLAAMFGPGAGPARAASPGEGIVIGENEPVHLSAPSHQQPMEVLAKIDTGATYSSIDYDLARELHIDLEDQPLVTVQSSLGEDARRLVKVRLKVAGRAFDTTATVSDRDGFDNKMLVGNRDLDGFLVDTSREQLTTPEAASVGSTVAALLEFPPPPPAAPQLLATIPLAAALIVAIRTLVGIKTFGLFAPVLMAMALVQSGLPAGLAVFAVMIVAGLLVQPILAPLRLPRVARLAVLLAIAAATLLATNSLIDNPAVNATWASAFPVVVTATIIERFWDVWEQEGVGGALATAGWTLIVALLACPLLVAEPVRWMAEHMPYTLALSGAVLSVVAGLYRGLRITELRRFRTVGLIERNVHEHL
jgi:hypothetical protein